MFPWSSETDGDNNVDLADSQMSTSKYDEPQTENYECCCSLSCFLACDAIDGDWLLVGLPVESNIRIKTPEHSSFTEAES